jgi:hypothetical protein
MSFDSKSGVLRRMRIRCADILQSMHTAWRRPPVPRVTLGRSEGALEALAADLLTEGIAMWLADSGRIVEAIIKIEQSWALRQLPETAIQLGVMYDLVNRHGDALAIYRQAFHRFPDHPRLRHEAGITLLRHGQPQDVSDFIASLRRHDPDDIFARFASEMLERYPTWVRSLSSAIKSGPQDRSAVILTGAVWGEPFTTNFLQYLCASLLAPGNLPALAERHEVHWAIFTTAENEARMKADPIFMQLLEFATIHFFRYESQWTRYGDTMKKHYGPELGPYYGRTCKFMMFSCAHYVALAAGRDFDCTVINLCADMVFDDRILTTLADLMKENDVVGFNGFRVDAAVAHSTIARRFRDERGRIAMPASEFTELFIQHIPDAYFADSPYFTSFPEIVCWRAGPSAVVVHATHYHPICIRPSALALPLELSIDPVDSRFLDRRFFDRDRIHFVRDMSLACMALEEIQGFEHKSQEPRTLTPEELGRWLWQLWGPWRAAKVRLPICVTAGPLPPNWQQVLQDSQSIIAKAIAMAEALEEENRGRKSWFMRPNAPSRTVSG